MKNKINSSVQAIGSKLGFIAKYKLILFIVLVAAVYGYIALGISSLSSAEPSADQISAQSNPLRTATVDKNVVRQLQKLQDNSVSVKALFEDARNNPFQE